MIAKGRKGSVELEGRRLTFRPLGTFGGRRPETSLPIAKIDTIHFKPAGATLGYIFFEAGGGGIGAVPWLEASNRNNGLQFSKEQEADFLALKAEVERSMDAL